MITLRLLGALDLRTPNEAESRAVLAQPKRLALLAYLAVASPRGFHRRDTLLGLLWPDLDEDHARSALSQAIYYLRRSLGRDVVVSRGNEEVAIDPDHLWCDATAFRKALSTGAAREALDLYRGDLLPGFFLSNAQEFERWLEEERAELRRRAAEAAWVLADRARSEGSAADAAIWGRRALTLAQGDEAQLRRLIVLLDRMGNRAGAVQAYEEFAVRFARDYEIDPSPETQALIETVRSRQEPVEEGGRVAPEESASGRTPEPDAPPASSGAQRGAVPAQTHPWPSEGGADHAPSQRLRKRRWLLAGALVAFIAALVVSASFLGSYMQPDAGTKPAVEAAGPPSARLAVLPLVNHSADPEDAYFADGLTEELISHLSRLPELRVIARGSVTPYKGSDKSMLEIGRELDVGILLQGTLRKRGGQVGITVHLIDVERQEHLWSEEYEVQVADVLGVQRDVAQQVAEALQLEIRARDPNQFATRGTSNVEAYSEYLKGRYFLSKLDGPSFGQARDHFQQALDLDPIFAHAWSGLAEAYVQLTSVSAVHASEAYPRARAAAEQALELDRELPDAHASLATALSMYYWDSERAEAHFRRAIELDPSNAMARRMYASHLRNLGRFEEALDEVRTAQELDPLSAFPRLEEGIILYVAREYDEAIAHCRRLLATAPASTPVVTLLALAYAQKEQYAEALAALGEGDAPGTQPDTHAVRGYIYALSGERDAARRMLDTLDSLAGTRPVSAFHRVPIHIGLGEHGRAIDVLEQAVDERTGLIRLMRVEPAFDPLRSQPRFQSLLKKVGLTG